MGGTSPPSFTPSGSPLPHIAQMTCSGALLRLVAGTGQEQLSSLITSKDVLPLVSPPYGREGWVQDLSNSCSWCQFTSASVSRVSATVLPRWGAGQSFLSDEAAKGERQLPSLTQVAGDGKRHLFLALTATWQTRQEWPAIELSNPQGQFTCTSANSVSSTVLSRSRWGAGHTILNITEHEGQRVKGHLPPTLCRMGQEVKEGISPSPKLTQDVGVVGLALPQQFLCLAHLHPANRVGRDLPCCKDKVWVQVLWGAGATVPF